MKCENLKCDNEAHEGTLCKECYELYERSISHLGDNMSQTAEQTRQEAIHNTHEERGWTEIKGALEDISIGLSRIQKEEIRNSKEFKSSVSKEEVPVATEIYEKENDFEEILKCVMFDISEMLVSKNKAYGNSALEPKRIFSKSDSIEQINVRIDDKLSRIANGDTTEDVELDLIGYLILKRIAKNEN